MSLEDIGNPVIGGFPAWTGGWFIRLVLKWSSYLTSATNKTRSFTPTLSIKIKVGFTEARQS